MSEEASPFCSIEEAIEEIRAGRMVVVVDSPDRENEGDLCMAASKVTPAAINFMAKYGRGLICLALTEDRIQELGLAMMVSDNKAPLGTAFTVSIDARQGISHGVSAHDRSVTIQTVMKPGSGPGDIVTPGHIFPLVARDGGVLVRAGHTEASVDVARLAGLTPAGVICEIMHDDGTMARLPELLQFAAQHKLKIGAIKDLIAYRLRFDHLVETIAQSRFKSDSGDEWRMLVYRSKVDGTRAYALQKGVVEPGKPTLVRVHVASAFYDMLGVPGPRRGLIPKAMQRIVEHGSGVILVLLPSPDIHINAGPDGNPVDERSLGIGAQILADLGISDMILLRNSSRRPITGVSGYGLDIVAEMPLTSPEA